MKTHSPGKEPKSPIRWMLKHRRILLHRRQRHEKRLLIAVVDCTLPVRGQLLGLYHGRTSFVTILHVVHLIKTNEAMIHELES